MKKLSVVIVSYNSGLILNECLLSIFKFNDLEDDLEVILVDNSPNHADFFRITEIFPEVICVKNDNRGFGQANNLGASISSGEYLFFLNPDAVLIDYIFKKTISRFELSNDLSMMGFKLIKMDRKPNMSFFLLNPGGLLRSLVIKFLNRFDLFFARYCHISGAAMFLRMSTFWKCGGFDEKIFMYYEEPDLTLRLQAIGGTIEYNKEIKIIHIEGGSTSDKVVAQRRRLVSLKYLGDKFNFSSLKILIREIRLLKFKLFFTISSVKRRKIIEEARVLKEFIRDFYK